MLKNFENLPYFTLSQLTLSYKDRNTALATISNNLRLGKLHRIREAIYVSANKVREYFLSDKITSFKEFIATNLIYTPSYLSLEYVLFENNILSENVYTFTLVSTKKTAKFKNDFWDFSYKSIKKNFFSDYEVLKKDWFLIYKASKEKALFDYLYFKKWVIFKEGYMRELRLNLENIDLKKFEKLLEKYPSKKVEKIFSMIKALI